MYSQNPRAVLPVSSIRGEASKLFRWQNEGLPTVKITPLITPRVKVVGGGGGVIVGVMVSQFGPPRPVQMAVCAVRFSPVQKVS